MFESDLEMRNRLGRTWKKLVERLTDSDFPAYIVYETLAEIAIEGMVGEHGALGATHLLRLKANAIEASEREQLAELINGAGSERAATTAPASSWA